MTPDDNKTDIAVLKNDVAHIKKMLDANFKDFKEHVDTAQPFRDKVNAIESMKDAFNSHVVSDRWAFGIMISLLIAILTKGMKVW